MNRADELARVKAERDAALVKRAGGGDDYRLKMLSDARERMHEAEDRLDKALAALREMRDALPGSRGYPWFQEIARAAIAEIEGERRT